MYLNDILKDGHIDENNIRNILKSYKLNYGNPNIKAKYNKIMESKIIHI